MDPIGFDPHDALLLHGIGLKERFRIREGRAEFLTARLRRLFRSAQDLGLTIPLSFETAAGRVREAAARFADGGDGLLDVIVTGATGGRQGDTFEDHGLHSAARTVENGQGALLLRPHPFPGYPARMMQGLACVSCSYPRPDRSPLDRHPILHDWPALLAASEAGRRGADLGLLPDDTGAGGFSRSTEGTLFARVDGVLLTPSIDEGARDEIERREVLAAASALGISTRETRVGREQLLASTEAFVAGPRLGIAVLAMLDGEALPLRPGDSPAVPLLRIRLRERGEADC